MASITFFIGFVLAALALNVVHGANDVPMPEIDLEEWWGPGIGSYEQDTSIRDFKIYSEEWLSNGLPKLTLRLYSGNSISNMAAIFEPEKLVKPEFVNRLSPFWTLVSHLMQGRGYLHTQGIKPNTVGFALADSPAGLMAYMLEKISAGLTRTEV